MVLRAILITFLFCSFQSPLIEKYSKQVDKGIKKSLKLESVQLKKVPFSRGELSEIYSQNKLSGFLLLAEVAACNLGGCLSFEKVNANLNSEYFDLLLLTDKEKNILKIEILDYFSDYGYEITSKKYLKKFNGKNVCDFNNEIDGIDAISGATISSYALEGMISMMCSEENK